MNPRQSMGIDLVSHRLSLTTRFRSTQLRETSGNRSLHRSHSQKSRQLPTDSAGLRAVEPVRLKKGRCASYKLGKDERGPLNLNKGRMICRQRHVVVTEPRTGGCTGGYLGGRSTRPPVDVTSDADSCRVDELKH